MKTSDFDYALPPEQIAQEPTPERDAARLLVASAAVPGNSGGTSPGARHMRIADLDRILHPGDLLVVNDTRVIPARLPVRRATGGAGEVLLLRPCADSHHPQGAWRALVRPAKKMKPGQELEVEGGGSILLVSRDSAPDGTPAIDWIVAPGTGPDACPLEELAAERGQMPLPPYIQRERADDPRAALDRDRYQTVFAECPGAVAAPTAGLHLTPGLLARLLEMGVERAEVTLHVGLGTFRPVDTERAEDHIMHTERFHLPEATVAAIERTRQRGGRVVAVGTTVVRVLESCAGEDGTLSPGKGDTDLYLLPGAAFRVVDLLLTNFHLPRSTLLMLVSAFHGTDPILALYRLAIEEGYRFYSYGDAMLIPRG